MEHILTPARRVAAAKLAAIAAADQAKLAKAAADALEKEAKAAMGDQGPAMGKLIAALADEDQAVATFQAAQLGMASFEELEPLRAAMDKAQLARVNAMKPFLPVDPQPAPAPVAGGQDANGPADTTDAGGDAATDGGAGSADAGQGDASAAQGDATGQGDPAATATGGTAA